MTDKVPEKLGELIEKYAYEISDYTMSKGTYGSSHIAKAKQCIIDYINTSYTLTSSVDKKLEGAREVHKKYGKSYRGHFEADEAKYYYRVLHEAMQAIKQLIESTEGEGK